jgi:hypothetical protein
MPADNWHDDETSALRALGCRTNYFQVTAKTQFGQWPTPAGMQAIEIVKAENRSFALDLVA